jgi:hypothetical protein
MKIQLERLQDYIPTGILTFKIDEYPEKRIQWHQESNFRSYCYKKISNQIRITFKKIKKKDNEEREIRHQEYRKQIEIEEAIKNDMKMSLHKKIIGGFWKMKKQIWEKLLNKEIEKRSNQDKTSVELTDWYKWPLLRQIIMTQQEKTILHENDINDILKP